MISGSCDEACHSPDMSDQHTGFGTLDGFLPILCQSAVAPELGEGALDNPSAGQNLEALSDV